MVEFKNYQTQTKQATAVDLQVVIQGAIDSSMERDIGQFQERLAL